MFCNIFHGIHLIHNNGVFLQCFEEVLGHGSGVLVRGHLLQLVQDWNQVVAKQQLQTGNKV